LHEFLVFSNTGAGLGWKQGGAGWKSAWAGKISQIPVERVRTKHFNPRRTILTRDSPSKTYETNFFHHDPLPCRTESVKNLIFKVSIMNSNQQL